MIGASPAWRWVCELAEQGAPSMAPVLLVGERRTSKALLAEVRVVAATSKNLAQEMAAQRFHPALYGHLQRITRQR
jgi:DNA-binding NtrC family response regulator